MAQDKIELALEQRSIQGKQVKQLRRQGIIPAVIHDHGKDSVLVQGDAQAMLKVFQQAGKHHPVALKAASKNYNAMIKDVDFEPKKHRIQHIVFNAVSANEKVEAEVPVRPRYAEGNEASPAERAGLLVLPHLDVVMVSAVPAKLPDVLEYDAEKLVETGDTLTVADLVAPEGVEILTEPTQSLATVNDPAAVAAANDALAGEAEAGEEPETENGSPEDDENSQEEEREPGGKAGSPSAGE